MLNQAIFPGPEERFAIHQGILQKTDRSTPNLTVLDNSWLEEAENRLTAYREGRLEGIPMEEVFAEE